MTVASTAVKHTAIEIETQLALATGATLECDGTEVPVATLALLEPLDAELALLSGLTATAAEINVLASVTAGTSAVSKGLVLDSGGDLAAGPVVLADMTEGSGITGAVNGSCEHSVVRAGGLFKTTILVDLTGLNSGGTAGDMIGKADTANSHIGQITAAKNGTVFAGRITCLETPATGDDDIDIYSAVEATGTEDLGISTLDETQLCNSGDLVAGTVVSLTAFPAADKYLYLVCQTGDANATYTAGILLIELWGK